MSFRGHTGDVSTATFIHAGATVVSASKDGTLRYWDARPEANGVWAGHKGFVYSVAYHPDGRHVVSGAWDGTARVWDVTAGREVRQFEHSVEAADAAAGAAAAGQSVRALDLGPRPRVCSVAVDPTGRPRRLTDEESVRLFADGSGIALIEQLARAVPRPLAVVATVFADDQHLFPALRAGAVGYVLKDGPVENLAVMLAGIGRGEMPLSARIAGRLVGWFHAPAAEANALLSPREQDLLPLLAKGLTIAQAAQALGIMPSTAASYAKTLYRKLDVTSRAEAALEAARRGLIKP